MSLRDLRKVLLSPDYEIDPSVNGLPTLEDMDKKTLGSLSASDLRDLMETRSGISFDSDRKLGRKNSIFSEHGTVKQETKKKAEIKEIKLEGGLKREIEEIDLEK